MITADFARECADLDFELHGLTYPADTDFQAIADHANDNAYKFVDADTFGDDPAHFALSLDFTFSTFFGW
jgi:hypothetical protein